MSFFLNNHLCLNTWCLCRTLFTKPNPNIILAPTEQNSVKSHFFSYPFSTNSCSLSLFYLVDASASQSGHLAANARKRFTLQGLSNRRSLPAGNSNTSSACLCFFLLIVITDTIVLKLCSLHLLSSSSSSFSSWWQPSSWTVAASTFHLSSRL